MNARDALGRLRALRVPAVTTADTAAVLGLSVEAASQPWSFFMFTGGTDGTPMRTFFDGFLEARLKHMETVLTGREWLTETFSVADILMADVLRLVDRFDGLAGYPACRTYVARATARPAFAKAHADQMAHFAAADQVAPAA